MKRIVATFDFTDRPELLAGIRTQARTDGVTQKKVVVEALQAYFASNSEDSFLSDASNQMFSEWDNKEDAVYDSIEGIPVQKSQK